MSKLSFLNRTYYNLESDCHCHVIIYCQSANLSGTIKISFAV
nr:MAG TPA: hypothetical protein [Caudoviricetes sp.]